MPARTRRVLASPALVAAVLLASGLALAWGWWQDGTPVRVGSASRFQLPCVSYAPAQRAGHARDGLTVAQLRRDLAVLAQRTRCIRTYTVSEGFERVPAVAREFGMQVLLGLWIGRDDAHNRTELATGILVARAHRDVVRAVVVGNEVLLRHERTPAQLATMLREVAGATGLPVTYADVWGFWVDHAELARDVSFVTVHILPYWDDEPVGIDEVIPYVDRLHADLQRIFPGKPLYVGETGWPTAGRPRGPVETGRVNQARFLAEFTALAARRGFDYNVIEAFDQPWKIAHEGTVGGHWGLHDARLQPKVRSDGTVVEDALGRIFAIVALLGGLLVAACVLFHRVASRGTHGRPFVSPWSVAAAFGLGTFAVAVAARQWRYLVDGNVTALDWVATLAITALGWLALAFATNARRHGDDRIGCPVPRPLEGGFLAGAAYVCLGLVFAGRHRDFPVWLFLPGVVAIAGAALTSPRSRATALRVRNASAEVVLAAWLAPAGVLIPLLERFGNSRSLGWGSACVLLGLSVLLPLALQTRNDERRRDDAGAGPREVVEHHAERADDDAGIGEPRAATP
jgi:exo-beta-1,3-glucanase (GH17 family)